MPAVLVQKKSVSWSAPPPGGAPTATATFDNPVTAGNFLTVQLSCYDNSAPGNFTDPYGGSWTTLAPTGVGGANVLVGYMPNAAAGSHAASSTETNMEGWTITICEWSGMGPSSAVDVNTGTLTDFVFQPGPNNITVPAQTLLQADELVLGTFSMGDEHGLSGCGITDPPTGFTSLTVQDDSLAVTIGATTYPNGNAAEHCYIASAGSTALPSTTWAASNSGEIVYENANIVTFAIVTPANIPPFVQVCS